MKMLKYILPIAAFVLGSCSKDFLDVTPTDGVQDEQTTSMKGGTEALVNGVHNVIYNTYFAQPFGTGQQSLNILYDTLGDDFFNSRPAFFMGQYRWTDHRQENGDLNGFAWNFYYKVILNTNKALKALDAEANSNDKSRNLGEMYAVRAWAYHNLVQLFGKRYVAGQANSQPGVVIRTEQDLSPKERSSVEEVYKLIDEDIIKSLSLLENFPKAKSLDANKNRIQYATACGIAARIALTKGDYAAAEKYAELAIAKTDASLQVGNALIDGFNDWSASEWMWAYKQNGEQDHGYIGFGAAFSYNFNGHNSSLRFAVNRTIYNKTNPTDVRRKWFVCQDLGDAIPSDANPSYFNTDARSIWEVSGQNIKFKARSGASTFMDILIMRLAEMYYIQAESEARQGKNTEAQATLYAIMRTRDTGYTQSTSTGPILIEEIMDNKRMELWGEGQRFFDMKRLSIVPDRTNVANYDIIRAQLGEAAYTTARTRNSGEMAEKIPTTANSDAWEFMIPIKEMEGAQGKVIQNPQ